MHSRQYTIRGVGDQLDAELRAEARRRSTSLNAVALDRLRGAGDREVVHHDLDWFFGAAADDRGQGEEAEAALHWLDTLPGELG